MSSSQAESVRNSFRDFVRLHGGTDYLAPIFETTLIRDGSYCGRKFSLSGFSIIWFIDEQQVKLFGQNGSLLESRSLRDFCVASPATPEGQEIRRAA